jgi:CMP/dCMP kinase
MLITLGGKAGSGKSTISHLLTDKLWLQRISIGDMKRQLAQQMNLTIQEFNILGDKPENQQEFDKKYEDYQRSIDIHSKTILESRLWFYCQPNAFKVFLDIGDEQAAKRILGDTRTSERFDSLQQAINKVRERNSLDQERYIKLYDIDYFDPKHYNLVIDTSDKTPEEISTIITTEYTKFMD